MFAVMVMAVGAIPDDGVTLSQPVDLADVVKAWLIPLRTFTFAIGEGSEPPDIVVSSTLAGVRSNVAESVPLIFNRTGISSDTLLPCTARVTTPAYVPGVRPVIFAVIFKTCGPSAVDPVLGPIFSHRDNGDTVAVNERFACPVLETATNAVVPVLLSMMTELGLTFRAGLLLTVRVTRSVCDGIPFDLTITFPS